MMAARLEDLFADEQLFGDASEGERDRREKRPRDDEYDEEDIPPLPPPLSPLRRDAHEREGREDGDDANGEGGDGGEGEENKEGKFNFGRKRKIRRKFDETVLCGPDGLRRVWEEFPKIKFSGKGHESSDLRRLMRLYEEWAHKMFPDYTFADAVERIEKLASMGYVRNYVSSLMAEKERAAEEAALATAQKEAEEEEWHDGLGGDDSSDDDGDHGAGFMRSGMDGQARGVSLEEPVVVSESQAAAIEAKRQAALARLAERRASQMGVASTQEKEANDGVHASEGRESEGMEEEERPFEDEYANSQDVDGRQRQQPAQPQENASHDVTAANDDVDMRVAETHASNADLAGSGDGDSGRLPRDVCETLGDGDVVMEDVPQESQAALSGPPLALRYEETQAVRDGASQDDVCADAELDTRGWD